MGPENAPEGDLLCLDSGQDESISKRGRSTRRARRTREGMSMKIIPRCGRATAARGALVIGQPDPLAQRVA